jgi:hypothetical protein
MWPVLLLFAIVFLLNLIPAFAPPTWMVFSYLGFSSASKNVVWLALVGAGAATLGRITLAKLSRSVIRQKFLSEATKQNIDAIRERLEGKRKLTFGVFLFYAFSPLPSNYLFIAYGLTAMELKIIALPFFLGRSVSYAFWGLTSSAVAQHVSMDSKWAASYFGVWFVTSQILLLYAIYLFTRIDWRLLFAERKLRLIARGSKLRDMQ